MARKTTSRPAKKTAKKTVKRAKTAVKSAVKQARKGKAAKVKSRKAQIKADAKTLHGELRPWSPAEVEEAFRRFQAAMPEPKGELIHSNVFTLLVAVVLSAQATDAGVNKATPALFALADTPEKMVELGEPRVRELIKTIGLYRTKAKNVIALSEKLIQEHGGKVPNTREALQALPGVGRKTANVVLNIAFGEPTMAVDTHIFRIGNRTGLAPGKDPLAVELKLLEVIPAHYMMHAHHWLILHGRYVCLARRPLCEKCVITRSVQVAGEDDVAGGERRCCTVTLRCEPERASKGDGPAVATSGPCIRSSPAMTRAPQDDGLKIYARFGSISSTRRPASRLCMWTISAVANSGVARFTIGIETNSATSMPAVNTMARLSRRSALASSGG